MNNQTCGGCQANISYCITESVLCCWHTKHIITLLWADQMMIFCSMHRHTPRAGLKIWKKTTTFLWKNAWKRCDFIHSAGSFFFFFLETYFEGEIISKTRIMILSQYLNNRKNKILNPKAKGIYYCHRESRGWRYFSIWHRFTVLIVTCADGRRYDTWLAARISTVARVAPVKRWRSSVLRGRNRRKIDALLQ